MNHTYEAIKEIVEFHEELEEEGRMPRISRIALSLRLERVRLTTGLNLQVEYSGDPQRPRIFLDQGEKDIKALSPRATTTQLMMWLDGFIEAATLITKQHEK